MMQMSEAAKRALINAGTSRQSTKIEAPLNVKWELEELGLIGRGTGLTRQGSIARERLMTEALDKAFG